ncbi:hypothetical protein RDWZM_000320 [Blomia tropicalis]|uniref:Major facilitator superfamily (MFS) profile domain-containing protein n=1 Tax=Blomia tropicalis TaxID=40697 RepID=A0A9Q0M9M8_BLOTA|nr:hypothetical protein RDWZM_000320 [Blomia tropicalis]
MTTENTNIPQMVVNITGSWGLWQIRFFIAYLLFSIVCCWHALQLSFLAPEIDYWCVNDNNQSNGTITAATNKCSSDGMSCIEWEYDVGRNESIYRSTIISEWNLVCNRQWLSSFTHSAYMIGGFLSCIIMSHCSDQYGRKPAIIFGWCFSLIGTILAGLSNSIVQFLISRMLIAFGITSCYQTGFVLILEMVGPKYRDIIGLTVTFGWSVGYISLPMIYWLIPDFRLVHAFYAIVQICTIPLYLTLYESPRWLLVNNRYDEAISILREVININGINNNNNNDNELETEIKIMKIKKFVEQQKNQNEDSNVNEQKYSYLDLFRSFTLARITLTIYFVWYANSLVYYGLSLNTNALAGNPFINFFLMGVIEIPAYVASIYLVKYYGNRSILIATCIGAGIGCWASISINMNQYLGLSMVMFGKFCVTCSYSIVYVYTTELFPTVVRTIGLGSSSMIARIASIMAPYVKDLTQLTSLTFSMTLIGFVAFIAGLLVFTLRESSGVEMPDKPEDVELQLEQIEIELE